MTLGLSLVLAASLAAAACDIRTRRIPNVLVASLLVCGLAVNALSGWQAVAIGLAVAALILVAGTVAFSFKIIGGGDVKLLAAAAGTLGYPDGAAFVLLTLLCGGVIAVAYASLRGRLRATIGNVQTMALPLMAGVRPAAPDGTPMPYAVAIFAGALCTWFLRVYAPHVRLLP